MRWAACATLVSEGKPGLHRRDLAPDVMCDAIRDRGVADRHPDERKCALGFIEDWDRGFFANPRGWM
ncbi:MAG: hypothetical protein ACHQ9S_01210 [Candidatus Binatia bacterium]